MLTGEIHSGKSQKNVEAKNVLPQRHSNSTWIKKYVFFVVITIYFISIFLLFLRLLSFF